MNVGIVGSRSIKDKNVVENAMHISPWLDSKGYIPFEKHDITIVSGGADGVDASAELIAEDYGIDMQIIEPDYSDWSGDEHPAIRRNTKIVEESDAIIAVWDGHSNGTRDTIDKTLDRAVPIYVHIVE